MKLWTAWLDYYATGEGRTLFARIAYAETAEDAIRQFGTAFDRERLAIPPCLLGIGA
jgi:hypothetical protein